MLDLKLPDVPLDSSNHDMVDLWRAIKLLESLFTTGAPVPGNISTVGNARLYVNAIGELRITFANGTDKKVTLT